MSSSTPKNLCATNVATRRATEFAIVSAVALTVLLGGVIAFISRKDLRQLSRSFTAALASESEGRERLRVTLGSIGDAVIATDAAGRVTFMNPVAEKLTGWQAEEAAGVPAEQVFRVVNEDSREAIESPIARVLREHKVVGLENHALMMTKDGGEIPVDDSCAPIKNDRGETVGAVLAFRDVSARRSAERERLEMQQQQLAMKEQQLQMREQEATMQAERARLVDEQLRLQNELVRMQTARLAELSTPLIPLSKQIVVMPLIGTIDSARATQILEAVTQGINRTHARFAIIDITSVQTVDTHVASVLINAAQAVQLLGSEVILTGIKPQVAQTLVNLGINLDELQTRSTLERGIAYAHQKADATIIQTLN